tara:strand:+ start:256 stop:642 length:387 start_codon:yes stop_codon:yes gene_type:complete
MNKLLLSGFLIALAFGTMGRPVEQVNTHVTQFPNATNQTCQECEKLVEVISADSKILNKTITGIIEIIRGICDEIQGPSGKECVYILNEIQQIVNWVSEGLTPPVICHRLGFCKNGTHVRESQCLTDL